MQHPSHTTEDPNHRGFSVHSDSLCVKSLNVTWGQNTAAIGIEADFVRALPRVQQRESRRYFFALAATW
jgi:hypothetical protein